MDVLVGKRLDFLDSLVGDTNYGKRKSALEREFEKFFSENCPVRNIRTATPLDVKRFLVTKDSKGKTQVHVISCEFLGKVGICSCNCPLRLASGTVQSILGQLKAIFRADWYGIFVGPFYFLWKSYM